MMESLSVLTIVRNVSTEVVLKNKIFCVQYFFFENHAVYEKMCEKYCKSERLQMAIGACALHAGYLMTQTHTKYTQYSLGL